MTWLLHCLAYVFNMTDVVPPDPFAPEPLYFGEGELGEGSCQETFDFDHVMVIGPDGRHVPFVTRIA